MAAEGGDEMLLIFATQTTAMIADLDIEGINPDEPSAPIVCTNVLTSGALWVTTHP